ncbi:MAG: beta strand repeat-containing protein [Myxococcota bacterium]
MHLRVAPYSFELSPLSQRRQQSTDPLRPSAILQLASGTATPGSRRYSLLETAASLRSAQQALDDVLRRLQTNLTSRVEVTPLVRTVAQAASAGGVLNDLSPVGGSFSTLNATREVNETTDTTRTSGTPLGLDLVSQTSQLTSSNLLNLDITTPERGSVVRSSEAVGLDVVSTQSPSVLSSSAEINTAPTSYSNLELAFTVGTSLATLSGVYAGTGVATGATALALKITGTAATTTVGTIPTLVSFDVVDQGGTTLQSYSQLVAAGDEIDLGADFGLKVSFSAGTLRKNQTSTATTVSTTVPTDVDPAALFDAAPNSRPRFEDGATVGAGSFTVNGTQIDVFANDSINTVLARINAAGAGVTAAFANDAITLTTVDNSEDDIVLAGDTSGFLSATRLSGATTLRGNLRDDEQPLADVAAFASVTSGTFSIDGQLIAVDPTTDTLNSLLNRINTSGARVQASFDEVTGKVVFEETFASEDEVTLGSDTSGFLAAAKLVASNSERGIVRDDQQLLSKTSQFQAATSGSFQVNGVTINVDVTADSLQDVLDRLTAAGAGVSASYEASTDKVLLETDAASESLIVVGADTTGLLALLGLATGNTVVGNVADDDQPLAGVPRFAAVVAGSLQVNGQNLTIDPGADSLRDVLSRINALGAGVTASYDEVQQRVVLTPDVPGAVLSLEGDTSGLLAALDISSGTEGTALNLDGVIGGAGAQSPLFERGLSVTSGTFAINGVNIVVNAGDSVRTVLDRLNASGAGVVASYDVSTDKVSLTATEAGDAPVVLGPDSSGLLAALKLDGTAANTTGSAPVSPFAAPLENVTALTGVVSGQVTLNGEAIAIDPALTSLSDLITAFDAVAGVDATLNEATGQVQLRSIPGVDLVIEDTSGVLAALGLATGVYASSPLAQLSSPLRTETPYILSPSAVASSMVLAARALNEALDRLERSPAANLADNLRAAVVSTLASAGGPQLGLVFDGPADSPRLNVDDLRLSNRLRASPTALDPVVDREGELAEALATTLAALPLEEELPRGASELEERAQPPAMLDAGAAASFKNLILLQSLDLVRAVPPLVVAEEPRSLAERLEAERREDANVPAVAPTRLGAAQRAYALTNTLASVSSMAVSSGL